MTTTPKTILITGCSTGIGHTTAVELKKRGHRVIATARKAEDVAHLAQSGFDALQLDLTDSTSIHAAVDAVLALTDGKLDALFNNGAYGQPGAVEDLSRDALREQFETNFFGTHELTNLLIPIMRRQGYGRIIYNSSASNKDVYVGSFGGTETVTSGTLTLVQPSNGVGTSLLQLN